MTLVTTIKDQIKDAMRAKDVVRLNVLRGISAAFTNELIAKKRKPDEELGDEDALAVIAREGKKRKDSIEQFSAAGRNDLAESETAELKIIDEFLPAQMERGEVEKIVKEKKEALGITDKAQQGALMSAVMKDLKGKADGKMVQEIVSKLL
ncbi:MAG: GatB/YqeY domain-containing protein [Patescibacteria group bacterium]